MVTGSQVTDSVYAGKHYLIGIAKSNLGSVEMRRKDYRHAERLYREALARFARTLPPDHSNVGISRIKLGRVLLYQRRFAEAALESRASYDILIKQLDPGVSWLVNARKDIVAPTTPWANPRRRPGSAPSWPIHSASRPRQPRGTDPP